MVAAIVTAIVILLYGADDRKAQFAQGADREAESVMRFADFRFHHVVMVDDLGDDIATCWTTFEVTQSSFALTS